MHLAAAGVSSLLVGVLATTLAFTVVGNGNGNDSESGSGSAAASTPQEPFDAGGAVEDSVVDDDDSEMASRDDTIDVGEGFTVTTWDGVEIDTFVHDFSVDEACKYGQPRWEPEKAPDSRIVQLTVDVANQGDDSYLIDSLEALSSQGYTQPVEHAFMYCNDPDDGANSWNGSELIAAGEKKLLYTAIQVQPDAAQLVLTTSSNGRMLMDIPEASAGSGTSEDGAPQPSPAAR